MSFRWLIRDVYTELLQAIAHANLPLFRIVEVFRPERSDTHNALFQTIVQLLPRTELDMAGPTESDGHSGGHQLQGIDLFLNFVQEADGSFDGVLSFNAAIFDRTTAERFLVLLTLLLRDAVGAPDAPMHDVLARSDAVATSSPTNAARRLELMRSGNDLFSPFEMEDVLRRSYEAVSDVVAFAAPHRELGEAVSVAVVLRPGSAPSLRELRAGMMASLPARWLPLALVYVDARSGGAPTRHDLSRRLALPLLSEKRDATWHVTTLGERVVASSAADGRALCPKATPPMAELLDIVLDAVETHTRIEHVAPSTPLMDAGLNSLSATQLALHLEQQIGVALPPTLIFQYSTAEAIARHLHSELAPVLREEHLQDATTRQRPAGAHVYMAGTAARWPGSSSNLGLAKLAEATTDAVGEVCDALSEPACCCLSVRLVCDALSELVCCCLSVRLAGARESVGRIKRREQPLFRSALCGTRAELGAL